MNHTIKISQIIPSEKKLMKELRHNPISVENGNTVKNKVPPEGYISGEEFFANIKSRLRKHYEDNGLL